MKGIVMISLALAFLIPAVVWSGEGDVATPIPWGTIITLALTIITVVAGGLAEAFRRALKQSYKTLKVICDAGADNNVDDEETKAIITAAVNCHVSWKEVFKQVVNLIKKSNKV